MRHRTSSTMCDGVVVGTAAAGAEVGAGVSAVDLPPVQSSAKRSLRLTTMVATTAAALTMRILITIQELTIQGRATTLSQTEATTEQATACNDSGHTIRAPERIWVATDAAIHARE